MCVNFSLSTNILTLPFKQIAAVPHKSRAKHSQKSSSLICWRSAIHGLDHGFEGSLLSAAALQKIHAGFYLFGLRGAVATSSRTNSAFY